MTQDDKSSIRDREDLRVMSFNIRIDTPSDLPDHTWAQRRDAAIEIILRFKPDLVGIQEALRHQLRDLLADLPAYSAVGRAREAGGLGEFVPILYQPDRFHLQETGDFWLSDTPEVEASLGWDAPNPRISTWAKLRDETSGKDILVLNTHFDRWGKEARTHSAHLVVSKIASLGGLPCLMTGDLNSGEDDQPFQVLKAASLRDSYRDIFDGPAPATVHHYVVESGRKIDFVLCDPSWKVINAEVIRERPAGRWPSDHYPVIADLRLIE